jgi:Ca2+-binding EF-hand superfamily protein
MLQAKFNSQDQSSEDGTTPLITKLDKYTHEELTEFRQVFNLFDTDRSGAIGLDEMENAITNLGMDPKQFDMQMLIHEADKRGNNQIGRFVRAILQIDYFML